MYPMKKSAFIIISGITGVIDTNLAKLPLHDKVVRLHVVHIDILCYHSKESFYCEFEIISTGLFILQNKAVDQHQRGVSNGICITAMSACKVIGPAAGGAILTWS